ncbi:MAG TPA: DUF1559 domain-containing protein [Pirellulales bacterium]|nr:DUF1559 domain-containing protein [Pirellulales bacterium]
MACSTADDVAHHSGNSADLAAAVVVAGVFVASFAVILLIRLLRRPSVFIAYGTAVVLVLLLVPAVQNAREASRRSSCNCNLKQLGLALQTYADVYKCFPPAYVTDAKGNRMHSWRVLILPFMEQKALYAQYDFNEPWNGPHNRLLADQIPPVYCCPSDDLRGPSEVSYLAVTGPGTIWPGNRCSGFGDIKDGTSNTLIIVESVGSGIHWMEPRDLPFEMLAKGVNADQGMGVCSRHDGIAEVAFGDGSVKPINESVRIEVLEAFATKAGGESINGPF